CFNSALPTACRRDRHHDEGIFRSRARPALVPEADGVGATRMSIADKKLSKCRTCCLRANENPRAWYRSKHARKMKPPARFERGGTADPDRGGGRSRCQGRGGGRRPSGALARRSPLALEAGGEAFRGLAGRSLAHRAGYAERSAEQLLLRA